MCLSHKRFLFLLLSFLTCVALHAQTLYWIGGSGNFNDPQHWSYSPYGNPAQVVPNAASNVVFVSSFPARYQIFFNSRVEVNSVAIRSSDTISFVQGLSPGRLVVKSGFDNEAQNRNFNSDIVLEFANGAPGSLGFINAGTGYLNADVMISAGKWRIKTLTLKPLRTLFAQNSSIDFYHSAIDIGHLELSNCGFLNFERSAIRVRNEFKVNNCNQYSFKKTVINTKMYDGADPVPPNLNNIAAKGSYNQVNVLPCISYTVVSPSCSPGCDGELIISVPSGTCYSPNAVPPYDILVDNTGCPGNPASLLGVMPGTYTLTGFCVCTYIIYIFDSNGNQHEFAFPAFNAPASAVIPPPPFTSTVNCGGTCTGSINLLYAGTPPYSHTVMPVGQPSFVIGSNGTLPLTNLCVGTLTVLSIDQRNCQQTFTRTFTSPPVLVTNSVATNISCNGVCSGSLTVSPSGGVANYTVAFNPGGSFTVAPGGTASVTGLCAGVVSTTLTDSKGCTAISNTTITGPQPLNISVSQNSVSCSGACTATAALTTTGGISPYSYTVAHPTGPPTVVGSTLSLNLVNLCEGTHTVSLLDNNNCVITQTFGILGPPVFTAGVNVANVTCAAGPCNGMAVVTPTGGNGAPYGYTWTPSPPTGQGTATISNLCGSQFTVNMTDAVNCTFSTVVTILQPPAFTVTAVSQSISCFGSCNGGATVTATGGNGAPYGFVWSPAPPAGQGTNIISNLCGGTSFTATISDASLCTTTFSLGVAPAPSITPNMVTTSITCNGFCNGSITAAPSGTAAYSYTLVSSTGATVVAAPPYTGLCAANYTLYIRDLSTNCVQPFTTTVAEPNILLTSINSTSISCFGQCDGTLAGNILGGTPGYTLTWIPAVGSPSVGPFLTNICSGSYTLNVVDLNGCTNNTATATLLAPSAFTVSITPTNMSCATGCNGALTANVSGATPGYTLSWSNGSGANPNINLCAGPYVLTVTDAKGCTVTANSNVTAPPAINMTQASTGVSCAGGSNGSATVTASGGTPPFSYTFPSGTNTTGIVAGLSQGVYIATATDANGCNQSVTFTITAPPVLSAAITGTTNSCNACTGTGTVLASGGTAPYISYVWTNSVGATVSSTNTASSLCPGDYTVTVTDANGCVATVTLNIALTVNITVVAGGTNIQCFGACTGSAVASPSGGSPGPGGYGYSWSPGGQTTPTVTNLCVGVYVVTVTDQFLCSNTATYTVTQPSSLTATFSQTNAVCSGTCNGAINTSVSGGTPPYSYTWSPGSTNASSLTGICAGTYSVQVRDANLCVLGLPVFTITQPAPITATLQTFDPNACAVSTGSICVTGVSGGSGAGYTYSWSPTAGNASCLNSVPAGNYSVTITDGTGSCSATSSTVLASPTGPSLTVVTQSINCFGGATGAATVTATGTGPFTFTWSPVSTTVAAATSFTATGLTSGVYVASSTDGLGCITTRTVNIAQSSSVTANGVISNVKCNGAANGSITLVPTGGVGPYTFTWQPVGLPNSGTVTALNPGGYTVTIADANLCTSSFNFSVTQPAAITLTNAATNVKCFAACNGSIVAGASGGTGALSYSWTPVGAFTGSSTATVLNLCPNVYTVTVTDLNNCNAVNTVTITEPPAFTSVLQLQNATCSNSCNAVAVHSVTGGTPTYTFSWSFGASSSATLSNLCAGNYTGTAIDANGCVVSKGFTVTPPAPFSVTLAPVSPACNSICSGSITTTVNGAQGSVTYNWSPAGSGQNPTGLCPGPYTLTAVDANNCEALAVTSLVNPPLFAANVSFTSAACFGNCNGAAVSTPTNATGAVSYTWLPSGPNSATVTGLCPGDYTVRVQDAAGCQATQTFTLLNPPQLLVNPSTNPATCGSPNGVISATATGGTPGYSYNWLAPLSSTNSSVGSLPAGIYTLIVSDANNCTNTITVPLSNSNGPNLAPVISTSLNCNNVCIGTASVDVPGIVGGLPPYTVSWLAPAPSTLNPLSNLCAGNYSAQVTDANGCILFTGTTILQPPAVVLNPSFGLPTCNGTCDGSLSLNPSGGMSSPFSYTWFPSGPNGPVLTNACAATYTILIGDNGCTYTQLVTLPSQLNIQTSTSVTSNQCFGDCNASATVFNTFGGVPPYSFTWSNGQTGSTATNLCSGTHSVVVTDGNGCFNTFSVLIAPVSQVTATTAIISPSCGLCNGASTITASGGTAPYTYSWTNGSTSTAASNLCAGLYQVRIRDNTGCTTTETVIINNSTGITSESISVQGLPCAGTCAGAATVSAIGGTAPYTYNWINPAVSGSVITNLCSGTYFVQMTDAQGCLRTTSVVIDPVTSMTLSAFIVAPGCNLPNGTINVSISGGTPGYLVSWNPPVGVTPTVTGISQGSYTITVTESGPNNCTISQQINVNSTSGPSISATQSNINCFNACTGSITATASGTATPFTYNWSVGGNTPSVSNLCKGVVTLTVTDANNCASIRSFTVTDNPQLQAGLPTLAQPSCGLCNGTASLDVFGGTLPYTYTWTTGATGPGTSNLCAGIYQVQVTDNLGCQQTETVIINNSNGITGETFSVQGLPCAGTCAGAATVTALGGTAPYNYNWISPAVAGSVITNLCSGTYFVQMTDAQGCLRTSSVDIDPVTSVSITPLVTAPSCTVADGAIALLISGGTPTYAVSWNPPVGSTATVTNIGPGSYTVTVTESGPNNCSVVQQINVSNVTGPNVTATQSNINCFNACTGAVTAVATGTATPFTYNWSAGGNAPSISNVCSGVITLTVTDATGCRTLDSYTITENPQLQTGVPTVSQPSCGLCNGTASLNAFGGTLPYTYTWTTGATGPGTSGLCAGIYQVQVTDNLGCRQTETVIINNSNGIAGETFSVQGLPCAGTCNGAATVTAIGGTAPYNYSWISPAVGGSVITNLCSGTYFVQMTDAQGCLRTSSVDIDPVTSVSITPLVTAPSCTIANGAVSVLISGGTPTYAVSWSPPVGSGTTITNIGPGSYTVTVTESGPNSCTVTRQINVSNLGGPAVAATQSNIACFNTCTGSVTAIATGTATPFSYNWSVGGNAPSIGNLCDGVITLTVTDANGCATLDSYTITESPELQAGVPAVTQPSCGLCNGTASLNVIGGTLPYTYTWTTGATGLGTSGLCAGIYQVQVTDNLGCRQTETVIINNSNGISGETFTIQGLPCNATCNGAATVAAIGGNAPVSYNWLNPVTSGPAISGLCAGTYFVQMVDAQGCIRTSSVDIDAVTSLSLSVSVVEPGCNLPNGVINVLVSGGTPTYAVSWAPVAGSTPTLSGIPQGSYTITVTESGPNNCTISQQINVSNATGPNVASTQTNINCFSACNGMVSSVASGTAPPFAYNWSVGGTAPAVTNLCPGIITLTVTDAANCVSIESYTITEPSEIQLSAPLITQPGCNQCNGVATVNAIGGSLPYNFVWTTGGTGSSVNGLCAGLYQVLITDNLGCQKTQNVIINNANGITGETFSVQDEVCSNNCNGSATVTAIGGNAPITYNWINPPVASPVITNLCGGIYFAQMTDAAGCIRTASTTVNSIPGFTFTPTINKPTCGNLDGSIDVTVNGGLPPYTYSWIPGGSTSSVITGIGPGTYTLIINDNTSCVKTQVFNISNLTAPAITFTQTNISCFNACTGSISVVASGSASPFTYNWSAGGSAPLVTNLCKGLVSLTVTASDGCKAVRSFTMTDSPELELSLPNTLEPGCVGSCNGAITLIPSGGSLPYTFSWLPSGTGNPQTSLCAGNYTVTITDAKGCVNTASVALDNPPPIGVTAILDNSSCSSAPDGSITVTPVGGTPAYTYSWTGPGAFTSASQNLVSVLAGTYSLSLGDSKGCRRDTALVLAPTITITAFAGRDTVICAAAPVLLNGSDSQGAVRFSWFQLPDSGNPVANTASFTIPGAVGSATYELLTVASVSSCVARDTVVVNVFPDIGLDAGPNVIVPVFSTVILGGNPTALVPVTLTWTPGFSLNDATAPNPVSSNTMNTTFTVMATDANGCVASDTVRVDLYPEVKIPNGFSPNADGKNDAWIIDYIDQFPDNTVEVYNRWGEQLFYSKGYGTPFKGTYKGKDLPVGTYYYIIHLNHPAYPKPYTGPLTIFR